MVKSDCEHIENLIPLYIDNMLSEEENDIVCEHIKNCPKCLEDYEFSKSIMKAAASVPKISVPENFHKNLMENVRKEAAAKRVKLVALRRTVVSFAAAAAVVALSVAAHINLPQNSGTQNPDDFVAPAPVEHTAAPEENETIAPVQEETAKPSPKVAAKPESKEVKVQSETNAVSDVSEEVLIAPSEESEETAPPVSTEESDAPSAFSLRDNEGISVARMSDYRIISVTVDESEYEKAEEILKELEKDETGYKLPEDSTEILNKLSEIEGFSSYAEVDETIDCDYIVLR